MSDAAKEMLDMLRRIEPYIDGIVCYASTMDEHEPNRIAHDLRELLRSYPKAVEVRFIKDEHDCRRHMLEQGK